MNLSKNTITDLNQDTIIDEYPKPNRTIKDDAFKALFSIEKYLKAVIVVLLVEERGNEKIVDTTLLYILEGGGVYQKKAINLLDSSTGI